MSLGRSGAKKKSDALRVKRSNEKKLKKLENERRGKKITTRKRIDGKLVKQVSYSGGNTISNIPKEGTRAGLLQIKGQGLGGTKNYKEQELKLSKEAKIASEKLKKEKNKKKTGGQSPKSKSGMIRTKSGALQRRGTVGAKRAERLEAAKERAKAMARKRLGK